EYGALEYYITSPLAQGTGDLDFHADGTFQYTPPQGKSLLAKFKFRAMGRDSNGTLFLTREATQTIKVGNWDIAPPALQLTAPNVTPLNLQMSSPGLLEGLDDSDSVDVTDDTTHGSLDWDPDGSFTYTPDDGFIGTDSFSYVGLDSNGEPNTD